MTEPLYHDSQFTQWVGDNEVILKDLPEHSVDAIMTSPPYYGLRKYKAPDKIFDDLGNCEHEWQPNIKYWDNRAGSLLASEGTADFHGKKDARKTERQSDTCSKCGAWRGQLGAEPQPNLYISHLCDTFDLCKRVLKKTGSLWINIADSRWNAKGSCFNPGGGNESWKSWNDKKNEYPLQRGNKSDNPDIPVKSMVGIPERFVLEMLKRGWIRRNTIIWHKRNVMPASCKDRFTEDFEYLYFFTQYPHYFFEQQFEPMSIERQKDAGQLVEPGNDVIKRQEQIQFDQERGSGGHFDGHKWFMNPLGRNMRTVWIINTQGSGVKHFATFPPALCTTPILASVPEFVCTKCGKPRMRIYEDTGEYDVQKWGKGSVTSDEKGESETSSLRTGKVKIKALTGLSDCGCGVPFVPGVILDHFGGSGTVALEARRLGREAWCIDISDDYSKMAVERVTELPNPFE